MSEGVSVSKHLLCSHDSLHPWRLQSAPPLRAQVCSSPRLRPPRALSHRHEAVGERALRAAIFPRANLTACAPNQILSRCPCQTTKCDGLMQDSALATSRDALQLTFNHRHLPFPSAPTSHDAAACRTCPSRFRGSLVRGSALPWNLLKSGSTSDRLARSPRRSANSAHPQAVSVLRSRKSSHL